MVETISLNLVRNSNLIKLVKNNILKPGERKVVNLPSGRHIDIEYIKRDSKEVMDRMGIIEQDLIRDKVLPPAPENYIKKTCYNKNGESIDTTVKILENGKTENLGVTITTPIGQIHQIYRPDGRKFGHLYDNNKPRIMWWHWQGNITSPQSARNEKVKVSESLDAFRAAVDYIRGKGSLETYRNEMAK